MKNYKILTVLFLSLGFAFSQSSTTEISDGLWLNSDGSSTTEISDGLYLNSDGSTTTEISDGLYLNSGDSNTSSYIFDNDDDDDSSWGW